VRLYGKLKFIVFVKFVVKELYDKKKRSKNTTILFKRGAAE